MYTCSLHVLPDSRNFHEKKKGIISQRSVISLFSPVGMSLLISIRVPLIVHDPRMPASKIGTLHDAFTLNIDLAPTILAAANIDPPLGMQGRNFAELYLGEDDNDTKQEWRDEFYYEHPNHGPQIPQSSALVRKDFKYIRYDDHQIESLFNLKDDTMELDDVINQTQYRETVQEMRRRWAELKEEVAKPPPYTGITV